MRLIDADDLKKTLCEEYEAREHYIGEIMLKAIDNAPTVEPFKPMCNAKDEAICEEMTTDGHCNCWKPCLNKEERPQVDCENCDFRKFTEKFVDGVVKLMNENDITSLEQLTEMLKGGAE